MVVINNSNEKQTIPTERFAENLKKYAFGTDILTQKSWDIGLPITIEPKAGLILELK